MFFDTVLEAGADPIFGLNQAFEADIRPCKVNLAVGVYKDAHLQTPLMTAVYKAMQCVASQDIVADYLPIDGYVPFCQALGDLVFGSALWEKHRGRIVAAQAVGGTGALQIVGQFLMQEVVQEIAVPHPTWPNHQSVFLRAGLRVNTYPYYISECHAIDFGAICEFVQKTERRTAFLLHMVCHNPTGSDLSMDEWKHLAALIADKEIVPIFDCAYHGFGEGLDEDRVPLELFLNQGCEMIVAYSCSKNFSLYNQRVGAVFAVTKNPAIKLRVQSQVKRIIRSLYSNPPAFGAKVVYQVLTNPTLYQEWFGELIEMRNRLQKMRQKLVQALHGAKVDYRFLLKQKGMFSFLDLDKKRVSRLIEEFAIYIPDNGRVAIPALNDDNLRWVADAISSL